MNVKCRQKEHKYAKAAAQNGFRLVSFITLTKYTTWQRPLSLSR